MSRLANHPRVKDLLQWTHNKVRVYSSSNVESSFWITEAVRSPMQPHNNLGPKPSSFVIAHHKDNHVALPIEEVVKGLQRVLDQDHVPSEYEVTVSRRMSGGGLAGLSLGVSWRDTHSNIRGIGDLGHGVTVNCCWDSKSKLSFDSVITRLACLNGMYVTTSQTSEKTKHTVGALSTPYTTDPDSGTLRPPTFEAFHEAFNAACLSVQPNTIGLAKARRNLEIEADQVTTHSGFNSIAAFALTGTWSSSSEYKTAESEEASFKKPEDGYSSKSILRKRVRQISDLKEQWSRTFPDTGPLGSSFEGEGGRSMLGVRNFVTWALQNAETTGLGENRFSRTESRGRELASAVYDRLSMASSVLGSRALGMITVPDEEQAAAWGDELGYNAWSSLN